MVGESVGCKLRRVTDEAVVNRAPRVRLYLGAECSIRSFPPLVVFITTSGGSECRYGNIDTTKKTPNAILADGTTLVSAACQPPFFYSRVSDSAPDVRQKGPLPLSQSLPVLNTHSLSRIFSNHPDGKLSSTQFDRSIPEYI